MNGTCKDCRHWLRYEPAAEPWERVTTDFPMATEDAFTEGHIQPAGACALTHSNGTRAKDESTDAFAADGEGYFGILATAPHFGCNQFAARTEAR